MVVSDVAVEKALDAFYARQADAVEDRMRAALVAALPVIERELREQIAQEIEAAQEARDLIHTYGIASDDLVHIAARVREGGRA